MDQKSTLGYFKFSALRLKNSWLHPAFVGVDKSGTIQYLSDQPPAMEIPVEYVNGFALPGFQNAHSHAFQYAMAGKAEIHQPGASDDFWSWREAMYVCALSMNPDEMQSVATMLYAEMLRKGYTHVAEFHYLHHDKDGRQYENVAEMGSRLLQAAEDSGIKITLIPVFYQKGGFGREPQERQRRFISKTVDEYLTLLEATQKLSQNFLNAKFGFSVHSLRAVEPNDIVKTFQFGPKELPFHLHAAEQRKEIEDSISYLKQRPVQWLLNNLPVNDRFHVVHCTHMNDEEVHRLATSGANAILCPGTEGNLGDGIFRLADFKNFKGKFSIGTDSHISLNPLEDLRWLDYAQRFTTHKRNTFDNGAQTLLEETISSGRKAMGNSDNDFFELGGSLDAVIYAADSPLLADENVETLLSTIIYTSDSADCLGTMVNGAWVVKDRQHINIKRIRDQFKTTMKKLVF
jgi:formimidoylglutamate deiminase